MIFTPWYTPAFKAGGPIQSCIRLVAHLKTYNSIQLITGGYDLHDKKPLSGILLDENHRLDAGVKIKYLSKWQYGVITMMREITSFDPEFIYINGLFSKPFVIDVILAHWLLRHRSGIILAVHGTCKPSALTQKKIKKKVFLTLVKLLGFHRKIKFHASNPEEKEEIKAVFGQVDVVVINPMPPAIDERIQYPSKQTGALELIFIGRVHPIKNLHFLLQLLGKVKGRINLRIAGVIEDLEYHKSCNQLIAQLPPHVSVHFLGEVPHNQIKKVLADAHLMVLPTLGENYGYAIIEALSTARPILISDQTPWKNLESAKAGWALPLSEPNQWIEVLNTTNDWDQSTFELWCRGALNYAKKNTNTEELVEKYREMFKGS